MSKPLRVLIVEDSEDDARLLERELRRAGFEVLAKRVETEGAMQSALVEQTWDLVISDYSLPTFNAPAALAALQATGLDLPFIIVSGTIGEDVAVECMRAGADDFFLKGNLTRLSPAVQRELEQAAHRKARRMAEESNQRLLRAVEAAGNAIFMTDPNGTMSYINPAFEKIYGYSRQEALGKAPRILKSGQHDQAFYKRFWQRLLAGESVREEFVNKTKDGQLVTVESSVSSVLDAQGRRIGFIAVQDDVTERKRTGEALRQSEQRFSLAFHASPVPIIIRDIETNRYVDLNEQFVRMLGYPRELVIGRTPLEVGLFVNAEDLKRVAEGLAGGGPAHELELQLRARSGEIHDVVGSIARIEVGSVPCVLAIFFDVTRRKRAEKRVLHLNRLLKTISEVNQLIVHAQDREPLLSEACRVLVAHGGFETVWIGFADAASGLVVPAAQAGTRTDYVDGIVVRCDDTPEGRGPVGTAIRTRRFTVVADVESDPSAAPWRERMLAYGFRTVAAFPLRSGGVVTGALSVYASTAMEIDDEQTALLDELAGDLGFALEALDNRDKRQRAEEASQRSEQRFRRLFDSNTIGINVADLTGRVLEANDAYLAMVGSSREELLSGVVRWDDITPAEYRKKDRIAVEQLQRTGVAQPYEKEFIRKDGTRVPLLIGIAMLGASEGNIIAYTVDLSARRLLEEQFRQAQKMEAVGQLAGGIAHDFNNVLTAILGNGSLLAERIGPGALGREELEEILKAGERAAALTRQLLAFSRRQVLEPVVLSVNDLIRNLEKMLVRVVGEDRNLLTRLAPSVGNVRADPGQLEQVIMNLVVNARDAMPHGGRLTIETANAELDEAFEERHPVVRPGRYVMVAVSDTGIGMDAETQARIFEPFFTTKEKGKGTGLGLSTAYGIVKQSGGSIWVYSEPGKGTTFKVYLPRVDDGASDVPTVSASSLPAMGTETILVVEDEPSILALSRRILENRGYRVLDASSGKEALERVQREAGPIHLLLTDLIMPDMAGTELASRMQKLNPDLRILFMSGYTDDGVVRNGQLGKRHAFLQKPFTPTALARKVREALSQS